MPFTFSYFVVYISGIAKDKYGLQEKSANARYYLAEDLMARSIWNIDRERALMLMQDAAEQGYEPAEQFLQENE